MPNIPTKEFYNEVPLTLMGERTPRVVVYKSESHKLHQAFNVVDEKTIVKGQPVKLATDGRIEPYDGEGVYLGIAVTDTLNPAYKGQRNFPVEVTVMVEAFCVCNYIAKEELATCGYVDISADEPYGGRFPQVEPSTEDTKFINLHPAAAGEIVQILIR